MLCEPLLPIVPQDVLRNSSLWWMMVGEENGKGKDLLTKTVDSGTRHSLFCFEGWSEPTIPNACEGPCSFHSKILLWMQVSEVYLEDTGRERRCW